MGANSLTFSGNQTTFKGIDATSSNFVLKATDNVNTKLFSVRNDGLVRIGEDNNSSLLATASARIGGVANGALEFGSNASPIGIQASTKQMTFILNTDNVTVFEFINAGGVGLQFLPNDASFHTVMQSTTRSIDYKLGTSSDANGAGHAFFVRNTANSANLKVFTIKNRPVTVDKVDIIFENVNNFGIGTTTPSERLHVNGNAIVDSSFATTTRIITLGVAATTFSVFSNVMQITGDGGGNTIGTITGAISGQYLIMIFVDDKVTITDDNGHGANTIDLSAAFTSLDDTVLHLIYDGTSWYEVSRSVN